MEPNDDEPPPPPFWLPPTTTINHHRRQPSSFFLNTGMLVILLLLTAIIFLLIVIPSVISLSRQVFNPASVKSSWNSLNVILVIFAIVCGFLSKKNDDQSPVNSPTKNEEFEHNVDKLSFNDFRDLEAIKRLRRSSSSYPDLRQEENVMINEDKWRFYDDTDVNNQRFQRVESRNSLTRSFRKIVEDDLDRIEVKNVEVDTFVKKTQEFEYEFGNSSESSSPSVIDNDESITKNIEPYYWPSSPPPPSPPPRPPPRRERSSISTRKKTNQTFETIGHGRYKWNNSSEIPEVKSKVEPLRPPPPPRRRRRGHSSISPEKKTNQTFETIGHGRYKWNNSSEVKLKVEPPSPPPRRLPPVVVAHYKENKQENRKKGGVNVITKEFFGSFYNQSKKKRKHKRRSYENLENLIEPPTVPAIYRSKSTPEFPPSSPPPPLPTPHSAFHNIFSKKTKTKKKLHSPPPPPPPPPQHKVKPPKKPVKNISFTIIDDDEIGEVGNETPLRVIPPPPPPPPFKMKPWHFVVQGDYVKIKSNKNITTSGYSSSSSSEEESSSSSAIPLFSPSPDVNIKADDFIARFRAKLNQDTATASSRLRLDSI